jgi:Uma2 family endonuclease
MESMGATKTLLTFEEFEQLPDQPGKRELLKGELLELPPAEFRHHDVSQRLFLQIHAALEAAHASGQAGELGLVRMEVGYKLARDIYVQPDVSITHAGQPVDRFLLGAPAIAIEVISPGNTVKAMRRKTELYFQHGAREVWRIDPSRKGVIVNLPDRSYELSEDETLTTALLPGFALSVREILGE